MYILTIMWPPILLTGFSYIAGSGDPLTLIPNDFLELLIFILLKCMLNSHSCNFMFSFMVVISEDPNICYCTSVSTARGCHVCMIVREDIQCFLITLCSNMCMAQDN